MPRKGILMTPLEKKLTSVVPSAQQISWQELAFYAFVHYGVNQFTNAEWGTGQEKPEIFNPTKLDTDQWCDCFVKAGMKAVIITAKHHDGFCLWDTKHTEHSVMHSPFGKDIVAMLANSCKKYNLRLGIYLSPWDRHDQRYGTGKDYDDYFCAQLTELLENYGDIFCCWFDGACGEGPNGKKQVYDWDRYYNLIRKLQPRAVISVCGPDVRWCGNEAGHCRTSEWSVVAASMIDNEKVHASSQKEDNAQFRQKINSDEQDLGSRKVLENIDSLAWYPAEVNTSIRPGWFYHEDEDNKIRSLEELSSIYIQSAGGNATFLLNIPPHPDGYIAEPDATRLKEVGDWLKNSFATNLLEAAEITDLTAKLNKPISPSYLVLQEDIKQSQRIEEFALDCLKDDSWEEVCKGTVVGFKRICPLPSGLSSKTWRLRILSCRGEPALKTFALY